MTRGAAPGAVVLILLVVVGCVSPTTVPPTAVATLQASRPAPTGAATPGASAMAPVAATSSPAATITPTRWAVHAVAPMLRARDGFRALVLGDDTVLVVGDDVACAPGPASPGSESSERYDPVTDEWSMAASLNKPRKGFTMVPAPDGGAMVIGGVNADGAGFSSTKRFDLDAAVWVDGPLLNRAYPTASAVTVEDGRIYVVGPTILEETSATSTVEILAPGRDRWDDGGRLESVSVSSVVRLDDGRLVVVGSTFESPDVLWVHDPGGAEGWRALAPTGFENLEVIAPVAGGGVLAFGLNYDPATGDATPGQPRRHDPVTDRWSEAGRMSAPRTDAQVTLLADGRILVAGGIVGAPRDMVNGNIVLTSEIYDPPTDSWFAGPDLLEIRANGQAITLNDGSVLVMGGLNARNVGFDTPFCPARLTSVERLRPAP